MLDVELYEFLHRDERIVFEQDRSGSLQHAFRFGVVAYDSPQLHSVDFRKLDEAEHVGEGVRATVAHASLVHAHAPWAQTLS